MSDLKNNSHELEQRVDNIIQGALFTENNIRIVRADLDQLAFNLVELKAQVEEGEARLEKGEAWVKEGEAVLANKPVMEKRVKERRATSVVEASEIMLRNFHAQKQAEAAKAVSSTPNSKHKKETATSTNTPKAVSATPTSKSKAATSTPTSKSKTVSATSTSKSKAATSTSTSKSKAATSTSTSKQKAATATPTSKQKAATATPTSKQKAPCTKVQEGPSSKKAKKEEPVNSGDPKQQDRVRRWEHLGEINEVQLLQQEIEGGELVDESGERIRLDHDVDDIGVGDIRLSTTPSSPSPALRTSSRLVDRVATSLNYKALKLGSRIQFPTVDYPLDIELPVTNQPRLSLGGYKLYNLKNKELSQLVYGVGICLNNVGWFHPATVYTSKSTLIGVFGGDESVEIETITKEKIDCLVAVLTASFNSFCVVLHDFCLCSGHAILSANSRKKLLILKKQLAKLFNRSGQGMIVFENCFEAQSLLRQEAVPVSDNIIEKAVEAFQQKSSRLTLNVVSSDDDMRDLGDHDKDCFYVEIWPHKADKPTTRLLHSQLKNKRPIPAKFGREVLADLLGCQDRKKTKDCPKSTDEEKLAFKASFDAISVCSF